MGPNTGYRSGFNTEAKGQSQHVGQNHSLNWISTEKLEGSWKLPKPNTTLYTPGTYQYANLSNHNTQNTSISPSQAWGTDANRVDVGIELQNT